ncbi:MAG: hypothetical protein AB1330_09230 [Bacillota bacterium]
MADKEIPQHKESARKGTIKDFLATGQWRQRAVKVHCLFILFSVLIVFTGVVGARYAVGTSRQAVEHDLFLERELRKLLVSFTAMDIELQNYLQTSDPKAKQLYYAREAAFQKGLAVLEANNEETVSVASIHTLEHAGELYRKVGRAAITACSAGDHRLADMLYRQELVKHRMEVLQAWEKIAEDVEEGLRESKWQEMAMIWWLVGVEGFLGLSFLVFLALYLWQFRNFKRFATALEETFHKLGLSEGGTGGKLGQLVTLLNTRLEKLHEVAGKLLDKAQHLREAVEQLAEGAEETAEAVMKATWAALKVTSTVEAVSTGTAALSDATAATARQLSEGAEKLQVVLDEVANLKVALEGGHAVLQRLEKTVGAEGWAELADFRQELSSLIALLDPKNGASGEMVRRISESLISCRDTLAVVQQFGEELKGLTQNILDLKEQVVDLGIMAEQHTAMVEEVASSIYVLSKMAGELEELASWLKEGKPAAKGVRGFPD